MSLDAKAMRDLENEDEVRSTAFEDYIKVQKQLQKQLEKTIDSSKRVLVSLSRLVE